MTPITEEQIEELQAMLDGSTPGAWKLWASQVKADQSGDSDNATAVLVANTYYLNEHGQHRTNDASLICAMQRALPALLSAARRSLEYDAFFREHARQLLSETRVVISHLDRLASGTGEREPSGHVAGWWRDKCRAAEAGLATAKARIEQFGTDRREAREERDAWFARATKTEEELATAKGELEHVRADLHGTRAALQDRTGELESARSQPSVPAGSIVDELAKQYQKARIYGSLAQKWRDIAISHGYDETLRVEADPTTDEAALTWARSVIGASQSSVPAGERPSDRDLRSIYETALLKHAGMAGDPFMSECIASGHRALFDAGVARGEAKLIEARAIIGEVHDSLVCFEHGTNYPHKDLAWCRAELRKVLPAYQPAEPKADPKPDETRYPCGCCGLMRTAAEGGKTFIVCDACWDAGCNGRDRKGKCKEPKAEPVCGSEPPECNGLMGMCMHLAGHPGDHEYAPFDDEDAYLSGQPRKKTTAGPAGSVDDATREDACEESGAMPPKYGAQTDKPFSDSTQPAEAGRSIERLTREELEQIRQRFYLGAVTPPAYRMLTVDSFAWAKLLDAAERDLASAEKEGGKPVWLDNIEREIDHPKGTWQRAAWLLVEYLRAERRAR